MAKICNSAISRFRGGQIDRDITTSEIRSALERAGDSDALQDYVRMLDAEEVAIREAEKRGPSPREQSPGPMSRSPTPQLHSHPKSSRYLTSRGRRNTDRLKRTKTHSGEARKKRRTLIERIGRSPDRRSVSNDSHESRSLSPTRDESEEYPWCAHYVPWEPEDQLFIQDELLQKTHHLRTVYGQDIRRALRSLHACYDKPPFPASLWKDILLGNYVDFGKLRAATIGLGGGRRTKSLGEDVELSFGGSELSAAITNGHQWTSCFGRYKKPVIFAFPHRMSELEYYGRHTEDLLESTAPRALSKVLRYDEHIRKEAAQQYQFALDAPANYMHLYTRYFTQVGAGCESGSHSGTAEQPSAWQRCKNRNGRVLRDEVCLRWNGSKECNESSCIFQHQCRSCGGTHRKKDCGRSK